MDPVVIDPVRTAIQGSIRPPGSKSITNRALICAALGRGEFELEGTLDSEDTQVMIAALRAVGVHFETQWDAQPLPKLLVVGSGGKFAEADGPLFVANSGTTIRFLTAALATAEHPYQLDGIARMRERPIGDLISALQQLGADAHAAQGDQYPPVTLGGGGLKGGTCRVAGSVSSQFLSGLLLAAPAARAPVEIQIEGDLVSKPYVTMTTAVMRELGADVTSSEDLRKFVISHESRYKGRRFLVEPDASAASYWWAAAAITHGRVTVEGLSRESLQGDVAFCECLAEMGCKVEYNTNSITVQGGPLTAINVNMNAISDTVQTLAVVALFATGTTRIDGVEHIRYKETDRLAAVVTELRKLGATVDERQDGIAISPGTPRGASIATYNDHRMAMSFALTGLKIPQVEIQNPHCVEKTYPHFFEDLHHLTVASR